jgi:2-polyprenyl-3-methyl-5-hydroxy-6-metoxy-1,4-benzoquinol methylase
MGEHPYQNNQNSYPKGWHDFNFKLSHWFTIKIGIGEHKNFLHHNQEYFVQRLREIIAWCQKENPGEPVRVLDIGCGRSSHLQSINDLHHAIIPYGMDISADELDANPFPIKKIILDACDKNYREALKEYQGFFHLVISHNFLEHIHDPSITHSMINYVLHPRGFALHSFPTLFDPLMVTSHLMPTNLAQKILFTIEPFRAGSGKFKTYYRKCFSGSPALKRWFGAMGFDCIEYRDYWGTAYFYSVFPAQWVLDIFYWFVLKLKIKLFTSHSIVTLQKITGDSIA